MGWSASKWGCRCGRGRARRGGAGGGSGASPACRTRAPPRRAPWLPATLTALSPTLAHPPSHLHQGQHKTYYHVKDIAYLLHEPLLKKARELYAYEKKVRRQRGRGRACGHVDGRAWPRVLLSRAHPPRRLPRPSHPQVRRAKAKKNRDLAARLAARKPSYRLDHLVRER